MYLTDAPAGKALHGRHRMVPRTLVAFSHPKQSARSFPLSLLADPTCPRAAHQDESRLPKPSTDAARTLKLCFLCRQMPAGAGVNFDVIWARRGGSEEYKYAWSTLLFAKPSPGQYRSFSRSHLTDINILNVNHHEIPRSLHARQPGNRLPHHPLSPPTRHQHSQRARKRQVWQLPQSHLHLRPCQF
jgi:hypothetical protein